VRNPTFLNCSYTITSDKMDYVKYRAWVDGGGVASAVDGSRPLVPFRLENR